MLIHQTVLPAYSVGMGY